MLYNQHIRTPPAIDDVRYLLKSCSVIVKLNVSFSREREFSSPSSISFSLNKIRFPLIKFLCFIYHHPVSHYVSSFVVSINYYCIIPVINSLIRSVLKFVKRADNMLIGCVNVVD